MTRMSQYIITTESGHKWLIEDAADESAALEQYYDGDAEPHIAIAINTDEERAQYLRDQGQAS
jgi:hypothetical protein